MNPDINDRIRATLEATSTTVPLTESDPQRARRRARQRSTRRYRAIALGTVAASSVGMVVGVQALSRPQRDTLRTSNQESVTSDVNTAPLSNSTQSTAVVETSGQAALEAPVFVWKVIEPAQDEAISGVWSAQPTSAFPTLAVSTAPGRSNNYDNPETLIWRTDDGISWTPTDLESPFGQLLFNTSSIGSHIFAVGTAPGVAVDQVNPVQVAFSDGTTPDWTTVDLPIDDNQFRQIPGVVAQTQVVATPLPDGTLVAVTPTAYVDFDTIEGFDMSRLVNSTADGVEVLADDCAQGAYPSTTIVVSQTAPTTVEESTATVSGSIPEASLPDPPTLPPLSAPTGSVPFTTDNPIEAAPASIDDSVVVGTAPIGTEPIGTQTQRDGSECDTIVKSWVELGVSDEAQAAIKAQATRFFEVRTDGSVLEVESPIPGRTVSPDGWTPGSFVDVEAENAAFADGSNPAEHVVYQYVDGGWTTSTQPYMNWASQPSALGDRTVGFLYESVGQAFGTLHPDGSVERIDVSNLFDEHTNLEYGAPAVTSGRFVATTRSWPDPISAQGGVEVTKDGVTIRRESMNSPQIYLDVTAGGVPIPETSVYYDQSGGLEVERADGTRVSFTEQDQRPLWDAEVGAGAQTSGPWNIVTTADGVNFSVESIADIAGIDDADINYVPRISSDGTQVVVAVSLNDRYPDETRKQIVLVGTPIN